MPASLPEELPYQLFLLLQPVFHKRLMQLPSLVQRLQKLEQLLHRDYIR